jgi:flagellar biosynthesis/type III secretory pathway protein FliH
MVRSIVALIFLAACATAQAQELHLQEAGSSVVLAHSTFAHGYRHGYEEGYHIGNTDINMGRNLRTRFMDLRDIRDIKIGYVSYFGPRKIFEEGFRAGFKAGYNDGYLGRTFRAVESLRGLAASLESSGLPADPNHTYFDQGFANGYSSGMEDGDHSSIAQVDFHQVDCAQFQAASQRDIPAEGSYCEGYRRGFALGHADGFVLRPQASLLEASK